MSVDATKVVVAEVYPGDPVGVSVEDRVAALEAENTALRAKLVERYVLTKADVDAVAAKPVKSAKRV